MRQSKAPAATSSRRLKKREFQPGKESGRGKRLRLPAGSELDGGPGVGRFGEERGDHLLGPPGGRSQGDVGMKPESRLHGATGECSRIHAWISRSNPVRITRPTRMNTTPRPRRNQLRGSAAHRAL